MGSTPVIIIAGILLLLLVWLSFSMLRDLFSMLLNIPFIHQRKFTPEVLAGYEQILGRFAYYKQLSPEGKKKFLHRTVNFIINKQFIGRQGIAVTDEMKVLISAAAVQLTFGLKKYVLPGLERILIYPDIFEYTPTRQRMKGGTSNASMMLSWKHFQEGFAIPDDRYNLGLHEMAHALKLHADSDLGIDDNVETFLAQWEREGSGEFLHLHNRETSILRKYGGTNVQEFFAVCTEHFFERPAEFKNKLPGLYLTLCRVYQQDPLNTMGDYTFDRTAGTAAEGELRFYRDYTNASWHWSLSILLWGVLAGLPSLFWFAAHTAIPSSSLLLIVLVIGSLNLVSWHYFNVRNILNFGLFCVYSFLGVGVTAVSLVLVLNFFIPVGKETQEVYTVVAASHGKSFRKLSLESNAYDDCPLLRSFLREDHIAGAIPGNRIIFEFRRGIFGLKAAHHIRLDF